jgi:hypothetical protein
MKTTRYEIIGKILRPCPLCSHQYSEKQKTIYHLHDKLTKNSVWACADCIRDFDLKIKKEDEDFIRE